MGTDDSIKGMLSTIEMLSKISQAGGGNSLHMHNCRAAGTVSETNGFKSNGIIPILRIYNSVIRYVNQNNNRFGASAVYLEPWHAQIFEFIELRKNTGHEESRTRDLFLGLWIPDLFMKRIEAGEKWSLFCPYECPGLENVYGEEFEKLYTKYESEGKARKTVAAESLWKAIIRAQIETGNPYMLYKDSVNKKSNQSNVGVIKSSNLCAEIVEYSSHDEVAVCNLASIALPSYLGGRNCELVEKIVNKAEREVSFPEVLKKKEKLFEKYFSSNQIKTEIEGEELDIADSFNLRKLYIIVKKVITNLNKIIDKTLYPVEGNKKSNFSLRPVGLGIQGLADVFALLELPFESDEARLINKYISETIYYAAVESSCELAKEYGPYEKYDRSPVSQGKLNFDLWDTTPELYNWEPLREKVKKYGIRNSLLIALMPTATTSQIFGFNECFEPFTSNIYVRRTNVGEFQIVNKYLQEKLMKLGIWNAELKNLILHNDGSIQNISIIPKKTRDVFKTVWEMSMKNIVNLSADRAPYVCQSQSLNIFMGAPTLNQLNSLHFYTYKSGLKTGLYYLRTKPASQAIKFTVDREMVKRTETMLINTCSLDSEECTTCGS